MRCQHIYIRVLLGLESVSEDKPDPRETWGSPGCGEILWGGDCEDSLDMGGSASAPGPRQRSSHAIAGVAATPPVGHTAPEPGTGFLRLWAAIKLGVSSFLSAAQPRPRGHG